MVLSEFQRRAAAVVLITVALLVGGCASSGIPDSLAPLIAKPVPGARGMVVSSDPYASDVGRNVLVSGGNAVDAAVATGFALAVTHPGAGNIGGGGFMVIRFPDGSSTALDFREKAPLAAGAEMFLDEEGEYSHDIHHNSHLAVGVPGTVAGFAAAHDAYGSMAWDRLVQPSVNLAREGILVSKSLAFSLADVGPKMEPYPASMRVFYNKGEPYDGGDLWKQPDLAKSLERIMDQGRDGFYLGETARLIAEEMRRGGGMISEEDLSRYEAVEREPIHGTYRGYEIISMPPPSSGGVALVQMLNILEGFDLKAMEHNSPAYVRHLSEAMRLAFRDRAAHLADVDFVPVPVERLISKSYAEDLRAKIDFTVAGTSNLSDVDLPLESNETTHYSVVDGSGMAVAVTYTLEAYYGSKIVVPGGGFLLNNEMGDFNPQPGRTTNAGLIGTDPNLARPEQRMLSSMSPTIIAKDGQLVAVVGSPGGRTIINTVLQVVLNTIEFDMNAQEAVNAGRIHHQWLPDKILVEQHAVSPSTLKQLRAMGYEVEVEWFTQGANIIIVDPRSGIRFGAPDPRRVNNKASGY